MLGTNGILSLRSGFSIYSHSLKENVFYAYNSLVLSIRISTQQRFNKLVNEFEHYR